MNPRLERALSQLSNDVRQQITVTPLHGGMTNQTYRLDLNENAFVLRLFGENTHLLGIDRQREQTCTAIVAQNGIGAEIESWISGQDLLMTRFIQGTHLSVDSAKHPQTLQRIITSVRNCHNSPAFPGYYSPFEGVRSYYHLAKERGVSFPNSLPQVFDLMSQIETVIGACHDPKSCHNDLLLSNFIDDGQTIRIIDWEYAAMGDPFLTWAF
jgi:thiamine kinase-like enzyme